MSRVPIIDLCSSCRGAIVIDPLDGCATPHVHQRLPAGPVEWPDTRNIPPTEVCPRCRYRAFLLGGEVCMDCALEAQIPGYKRHVLYPRVDDPGSDPSYQPDVEPLEPARQTNRSRGAS